MNDELTPTMRTSRLRPLGGSKKGPRDNYTRQEFTAEITDRKGVSILAEFRPEYGGTWSCIVKTDDCKYEGRGTYPASAFNDAISGRFSLQGAATCFAWDIDGRDYIAKESTAGRAIESAYTRLIGGYR